MSAPGSWDACPHCGEVHAEHVLVCPNTERALPLEGRLISGKFRVLGKLGEGGMSTVWRAENVLVKKRVALKLMHPEYAGNPRTLERFRNEATSAGRIGSHHICDILDFGESVLGPFIVMELLRGQSLADLLERHGRVEPGFAVHVVRQALVGLGAAHAAGIIHRDLKPENVFLHEPQSGRLVVKLMDFGISKFTEGAGQGKTGAGVLMGTPDYMSPEQAEGAANVDARTDIWAMGVMLYAAIGGKEPFLGPTLAATLLAVTTKDPEPLTQLAPDVDPGLAEVVHGCLAKAPERRIASAEALSGSLAPYEVPGLPPPAPSIPYGASASGPVDSASRETPQSNPSTPPTYVPESIGPAPPAAESKETWSNELGSSGQAPGQSWTMGVEEVEERHESLSGGSRGGGMGWVVILVFAVLGGVGGFFLYRGGVFDSLLGGASSTTAVAAGTTDGAGEAGTTGDANETQASETTGSEAESGAAETGAGESGDAETGGEETGADETGDEGGAEAGAEGGAEGGADTGGGTANNGGDPPFQQSKVVSAGGLYAPRKLGPRGNWRKAGGYCGGLKSKKFAGITNWRRPSVNELLKFKNKKGISKTKYWTSQSSGNDATAVLLLDGSPRQYPKSENSPRAFCVGRR